MAFTPKIMNSKAEKTDISAVIFDVDGTLVNVEERFFHYYNKTLESFGIKAFDREAYEDMRRRGALSEPIPDAGQARADFWLEFIGRFSLADETEWGHPFPGVKETLAWLRDNNYGMAVVTGRTSEPSRVKKELDFMGIGHFFPVILSNDDGIGGMNKAGKLLECAGRIGALAAECAYVGDWEGDIISAREAGFGLVVAVLTGGEGEEVLRKHRPDVILSSVADLPGFLAGERSFSSGAR